MPGARNNQGAGGPPTRKGERQSYQQALAQHRADSPRATTAAPTGPAVQPEPPAERKTAFGRLSNSTLTTKLILVVGFVGVGLWLTLATGHKAIQEARDLQSRPVTFVLPDAKAPRGDDGVEEVLPCNPEEAERLQTMWTEFLDASEYRDGVPMTVRNGTEQVAFVSMETVGSKKLATTLVVMPGEAIRFRLAGRGAAGSVSVGSHWCNRLVGWKDGRTMAIPRPVIATRDTLELKGLLHERAGGKVGMMIFNERPGQEVPRHFRW